MTQGQSKAHDQTTPQQQQQEHHHYHQNAAQSHDQAAEHHKKAAKYHESGDHKTAAHHAHIAHGHSIQATEHEAECCKEYSKTHSCCENSQDE